MTVSVIYQIEFEYALYETRPHPSESAVLPISSGPPTVSIVTPFTTDTVGVITEDVNIESYCNLVMVPMLAF